MQRVGKTHSFVLLLEALKVDNVLDRFEAGVSRLLVEMELYKV
ncbi:hypothetical protein RBH29_10730 [Herbivorax sp. ANBcel31]|nr:hypothetical protein [Herbivorax sp. ANBcel31]MDQ2086901.1 hypothetical protein [Herbivorax sp. ANBcel31]